MCWLWLVFVSLWFFFVFVVIGGIVVLCCFWGVNVGVLVSSGLGLVLVWMVGLGVFVLGFVWIFLVVVGLCYCLLLLCWLGLVMNWILVYVFLVLLFWLFVVSVVICWCGRIVVMLCLLGCVVGVVGGLGWVCIVGWMVCLVLYYWFVFVSCFCWSGLLDLVFCWLGWCGCCGFVDVGWFVDGGYGSLLGVVVVSLWWRCWLCLYVVFCGSVCLWNGLGLLWFGWRFCWVLGIVVCFCWWVLCYVVVDGIVIFWVDFLVCGFGGLVWFGWYIVLRWCGWSFDVGWWFWKCVVYWVVIGGGVWVWVVRKIDGLLYCYFWKCWLWVGRFWNLFWKFVEV